MVALAVGSFILITWISFVRVSRGTYHVILVIDAVISRPSRRSSCGA